MANRVTRNDVANRAGVSSAVVSYVVNNSNYVSEEKRRAVLKAIEELGYTPNAFAKSLKTNRSYQIALVGDSLQTELFSELTTQLYDKGYFASLFYSQPDEGFIKRIVSGRFDAVFMTSNSFSSEQLNSLVKSGAAMVLYKSRPYEGLDPRIASVAIDVYDSVKKSVDYLVLKGHTRIAYVPPLRYKTEGINGNDFRLRAYIETLEAHGIKLNPDFVCLNTKNMDKVLGTVFNLMTSLSADERPTAFVTCDDLMAAQIIQYLKKLNLRVPEDCAVIGWGNVAASVITTPQLTTVDCAIKNFAGKACNALLSLIDGERPADEFTKVTLVIRDSA